MLQCQSIELSFRESFESGISLKQARIGIGVREMVFSLDAMTPFYEHVKCTISFSLFEISFIEFLEMLLSNIYLYVYTFSPATEK